MWEQDRAAGFSGRIASRCSLSRTPRTIPDQRCPLLELVSVSVHQRKGRDAGALKDSEEDIRSMVSVNAVPSLSSGSPSSPSLPATSLDTGLAAGLAGNNLLEDDGTGMLLVPADSSIGRSYVCLFHVLSCHETFDSVEQWKTHVLSHFRTHAPPNTARCPLCPDEKFVDSSRSSAWDLMLDHVDVVHFQQGHSLARSRPDFELMQYLYRLKIISDDQFKAMQLPPPPSSPAYHRSQDSVRANIGSSDEPYYAPYSRRREERMRGQRRGISVA